MREWKKQSHATWYCLSHIVFIPKYRKKAVFGRLRTERGRIFHELRRQFERGLIEGHVQPDHIHMRLSLPAKYEAAQAAGRLKGKSHGSKIGLCGHFVPVPFAFRVIRCIVDAIQSQPVASDNENKRTAAFRTLFYQ